MKFWKYILIVCFAFIGVSITSLDTTDVQAKNGTLKFAPKEGTYTYVLNYDHQKYNEKLEFEKSKYGVKSTEASSPNVQFYNESSKKLSYGEAIGDFAFTAKYPLKTGQALVSGREYYTVKVRATNKTIKTKAGTFKKVVILRSSLKGSTKNYSDYYLAPGRGIVLEKNRDGSKSLELVKYNSKKDQAKLFSKFFYLPGGSSLIYHPKSLYKYGWTPKYEYTFSPFPYLYRSSDLYYEVSIKGSSSFGLNQVIINANGKKKSISINQDSNFIEGNVVKYQVNKNSTLLRFLKSNVRVSKKVQITYIGKQKKVTKTLTKTQKQAIIDTIKLYEDYLK